MRFMSVREQLNAERKRNAILTNKLYKQQADLEYVAMMADIDLDEPEEAENEQEV